LADASPGSLSRPDRDARLRSDRRLCGRRHRLRARRVRPHRRRQGRRLPGRRRPLRAGRERSNYCDESDDRGSKKHRGHDDCPPPEEDTFCEEEQRDGNDRIFGGSGFDTISGNGGDDRISAGSGNDTVTGDSGADRIDGGTGGDSCRRCAFTPAERVRPR
jgi:RTX calcium-binding nonapeptide repeat (4 copies)